MAPVSKDVKLKAIEIAQKFRKDGIKTEVDLVGRKLKKILNQANNLQVDYVILVGERDLKEGKVTVKNMESGEQELVEIESVTQMMIDLLK